MLYQGVRLIKLLGYTQDANFVYNSLLQLQVKVMNFILKVDSKELAFRCYMFQLLSKFRKRKLYCLIGLCITLDFFRIFVCLGLLA